MDAKLSCISYVKQVGTNVACRAVVLTKAGRKSPSEQTGQKIRQN